MTKKQMLKNMWTEFVRMGPIRYVTLLIIMVLVLPIHLLRYRHEKEHKWLKPIYTVSQAIANGKNPYLKIWKIRII